MRLETERLILRDWRDSDRPIYASYNADPEVRRYYENVLTRDQTDEVIDRFIANGTRDGFGFLAVERKSDAMLLGDVGMTRLDEVMRAAIRGRPEVEIGWIIGRPHWGQGYCPEAARACLAYAFGTLGLPEVVAFTAITNLRSQRVMEKIGMTRDL